MVGVNRTNIKDVAKAAGVSITTVSRALNGYSDVSAKTREKIIKLAEELNYAPDVNARSLGGMSEITIGLLMSNMDANDISGFAFGIISGSYNACMNNGCEFVILVTNTMRQEKISYLQFCRKKNVDGVVVAGLKTDDPYYHEVLKSKIPCALIDINVEEESEKVCSLSIDNIAASQQAVTYLIEQGHTNIAMLNGRNVASVSKERFSGYAMALLNAGIILNLEYLRYCEFNEKIAYEETKKLLSQHKGITAIFCASDLMAVGAIRGALDIGLRVPQDISVVGFDDIPIAEYYHGGITTIRQHPYDMGFMACETVYNMMFDKKSSSKIITPHEFIIRNTVSKKE